MLLVPRKVSLVCARSHVRSLYRDAPGPTFGRLSIGPTFVLSTGPTFGLSTGPTFILSTTAMCPLPPPPLTRASPLPLGLQALQLLSLQI
eukprot:4714047-Pyramimonas_sp.AAC.2